VAKKESPLELARRLFAAGDVVAARRELEARAHDSSQPANDRQLAEDLAGATRIDHGALWVGVACIGLLVMVVAVTLVKQP